MSIQDKAHQFAWCSQSLERLRAELDAVMRDAPEPAIPAEPGGWWHNYVCPRHHTELVYDPLERDAHMYACPYGCKLQGEPYRGAWLVFRHQAMARYALQAAAVYAATGDSRYAQFGRKILIRYAEQFPRYPVHPDAQPWMLKGRAFHQALTEAIWATTMIRAYLLLADEGVTPQDSKGVWNEFLTMLEQSMEESHSILTRERQQPESNYTAWLNAALCCIHAARGDRSKLEQVLGGEGGYRQHLSIAVRPDQLEYEGSTYYHLFVLRAYLITAEMAGRFGIDLHEERGDQGQSLEGMLDVMVQLAGPGGQLPALHDGPYGREPFAREIAEIFEAGLSRYAKRGYEAIAAHAYTELYGIQERSGLEAVLYGTGPWPQEWPPRLTKPIALTAAEALSAPPTASSFLLPDSGFARLRHDSNPLSALIDFGPHGGSHGHFDKLNLMLFHRGYPVSPDRGTVPYGSPLKKKWYAETACHNTVSVGGRSQLEAVGECMKFEAWEQRSYIWTRVQGTYEGAVLDRHVLLNKDWLLDWFEVDLEDEQQIDWWFHYLGSPVGVDGQTSEMNSDGPAPVEDGANYQDRELTSDWQQLGDGGGYEYIDVHNRSVLRGETGHQASFVIQQEDTGARGVPDVSDYEGNGGTGSANAGNNNADNNNAENSCAGNAKAENADAENAETENAKAENAETDNAKQGKLSVTLLLEPGSSVHQVRSPGPAIDPSTSMNGILHRQFAKKARFLAVYAEGNTPVKLRWNGSELVISGGNTVSRVVLTADGLQEAEGASEGGDGR